MLQRQRQFYTAAEYLALEEKADTKSEYYQGEIFAMSGASFNHNIIASNVCTMLNQSLQDTDCVALPSDLRIFVEAEDLYTYPDVSVVCGQPNFVSGRNDTITNPVVLVEVLSKSTQRYDRGAKFELYRSLVSFRDYVLIDQTRIYLEHYYKQDRGGWAYQVLTELEDTLTLQSIHCTLSVERLYHKVLW